MRLMLVLVFAGLAGCTVPQECEGKPTLVTCEGACTCEQPKDWCQKRFGGMCCIPGESGSAGVAIGWCSSGVCVPQVCALTSP